VKARALTGLTRRTCTTIEYIHSMIQSVIHSKPSPAARYLTHWTVVGGNYAQNFNCFEWSSD